MTTFTSPFTGTVVQPTDVSYTALAIESNVTLSWSPYTVPGDGTVAAARIMDCTPDDAGWVVTLPPGNQGSTGTDILFRNMGADSFFVEDIDGFQAIEILAGESRYVYLSDNSTEAGTYENVTFGAGTSAADAATLVGNGLVDILGRLATGSQVVETSINTTLTENNRSATYVWNGGAGTITLPSTATANTGWFVNIRNSGTGSVVITPPATKTINGLSSLNMLPSDSAVIIMDFSTGNFFTVGLPRQVDVSFTAATYDVDSIVGNTLDLTTYAPTIQTYIALSGTRTVDLDVVLPAITQMYIISNQTGQSSYDVNIEVTGTALPPIQIANGSSAIILTSGANAFLLTQAWIYIYYAVNGTTAAPSFSFSNDINTGMYLKATSRPAISAGSTDMMIIDNTNALAPKTTFTGEVKAGLISGGTF
jgi:hypothetical protein